MPHKASGNGDARLIARSAQGDAIADLRAFAWEVLRRREDYRGSHGPVIEEGAMEMITADPAPRQWGLCFR